jgi:hypothetical protein
MPNGRAGAVRGLVVLVEVDLGEERLVAEPQGRLVRTPFDARSCRPGLGDKRAFVSRPVEIERVAGSGAAALRA